MGYWDKGNAAQGLGGLHPSITLPNFWVWGFGLPGILGLIPLPGTGGSRRGFRVRDVAPHGGYRPPVLFRVWGPQGRGVCVGLTVQDRLLRGYRNRASVAQQQHAVAVSGD